MKILKKEGKINDAVIENMLSWHHTGFHVHIGARIWPEDETALGNLAKYIVRASFSRERMLYIPAEKSAGGSARVVYRSKDLKKPNKPSTPSTGSRGSSFIFRTNTSSSLDTSDFTQTSREA